MRPTMLLSSLLLLAAEAAAAPTIGLPYDMPNGSGQASGGTFNYWDVGYTGVGNTTIDGAPLTHGTGKLSDGEDAADPWYLVSNEAGTGPHVGWLSTITPDPEVTFRFPIPACRCIGVGENFVSSVTIWIDNTEVGGVGAPLAILINGISYAFAPPPVGATGPVDIPLGLEGYVFTIQFVANPAQPWVFVSEITFDAEFRLVPEPATAALFGLGLLGFVALRGRTPSACEREDPPRQRL